jgi:hypothetical protein
MRGADDSPTFSEQHRVNVDTFRPARATSEPHPLWVHAHRSVRGAGRPRAPSLRGLAAINETRTTNEERRFNVALTDLQAVM